jgi:hypothetical protein
VVLVDEVVETDELVLVVTAVVLDVASELVDGMTVVTVVVTVVLDVVGELVDGMTVVTVVVTVVLDVVGELVDGMKVVVTVVVVLGVAPSAGHAWPSGRGSQTSVNLSLSFRLGRPPATARTLIVRFPAFRPRVFTMSSVNGPQAELVSEGTLAACLGLTFTFRSCPGLQPGRVWFTHRATRNVHDLFGESTPSLSHVGSQSVHLISVPLSLASTWNSARQSVDGSVRPLTCPARAGAAIAMAATKASSISALAVRVLLRTGRLLAALMTRLATLARARGDTQAARLWAVAGELSIRGSRWEPPSGTRTLTFPTRRLRHRMWVAHCQRPKMEQWLV